MSRRTTGLLHVTPPVRLAQVAELTEGFEPFVVAPAGAGRQQLLDGAAEHGWLLVPAEGSATEPSGRPSHIGTILVDTQAPPAAVDAALTDLSDWCGSRHLLSGVLVHRKQHATYLVDLAGTGRDRTPRWTLTDVNAPVAKDS